METMQELYTKKGELITKIEVAQAELQQVNQKIVTALNAAKSEPKEPDLKVE